MFLNKLQLIYENVKKTLIKEEFKSTKLKELFNFDKDKFNNEKLKNTRNDAEYILTMNLPKSADKLWDKETRDKFIESLIAEKRKLEKITLIEEYLKFIAPDDETQVQLMSDLHNMRVSNPNKILDFGDVNSASPAFNMVLSNIDAANVTDDDIQIFTKAENDFKDFNRKVRKEFSYVIGVKNNKCIGIISFDDNGKVWSISSPFSYRFGRDPKLVDILESSTELIAIKREHATEAADKQWERKKLQPYNVQRTPEEADEKQRQINSDRYSRKIFDIRSEKGKANLQGELQSVLDFAASVGRQAKELLKDQDIFAIDSPIADEFLEFITVYKQVRNELPKISAWDSKKVAQLINNLKYKTNKLEEKLNDIEENAE